MAEASPDNRVAASRHLPYEINPRENRIHYYETLWKRVALDLLLKHCQPQGKTVLDYGCGRGETVQIFGEAGFAVSGADIDPECVRLTGRFGPAVILQPESGPAQFERKSFDIVTCFHVLEHVENPKQTLTALAQIARDYVVLAVPNLRQLRHLFVRRMDKTLINEGHLQSWDHWHLLNLAERYCGLELVEWGFDATILSGVSHLAERLLGNRLTIKLETGLFRKLFPFHGLSVIGLFRVKQASRRAERSLEDALARRATLNIFPPGCLKTRQAFWAKQRSRARPDCAKKGFTSGWRAIISIALRGPKQDRAND